MLKIGILGSTRGTAMLPIIQAVQEKRLNAEIAVVLSNRPDALILTRAKQNGLPSEYIAPVGVDRVAYDEHLSAVLKHYQVDLVLLIGYMKILSQPFVETWRNKLLNVHPSLLPAFSGKMDLAVHQAVIDAKAKETGCTVHWVTETVDGGPIFIQKKCPVLPGDSPETLKKRVQALEGEAFIEAIQAIIHPL